jgi:hypothetical protein
MGPPPMERSWSLRATNMPTFCWILAKGRRSAAVYLSQRYPYSRGLAMGMFTDTNLCGYSLNIAICSRRSPDKNFLSPKNHQRGYP